MLGRRIAEPHVAKKQLELNSEVEVDEDKINESVIDTLPEYQQVNAKKIMRVLRSHCGDLMSRPADGDVSIHGKPLRRVNVTNLLSRVVPFNTLKEYPQVL